MKNIDTNRKDFLNNPQKYLEKEIEIKLFLSKLDKEKSVLYFLPDRSHGVPQCIFELQTDNTNHLKFEENQMVTVKFSLFNVKQSEEPIGLRDYGFYLWGKLLSINKSK